jgi:hypothetical protein
MQKQKQNIKYRNKQQTESINQTIDKIHYTRTQVRTLKRDLTPTIAHPLSTQSQLKRNYVLLALSFLQIPLTYWLTGQHPPPLRY